MTGGSKKKTLSAPELLWQFGAAETEFEGMHVTLHVLPGRVLDPPKDSCKLGSAELILPDGKTDYQEFWLSTSKKGKAAVKRFLQLAEWSGSVVDKAGLLQGVQGRPSHEELWAVAIYQTLEAKRAKRGPSVFQAFADSADTWRFLIVRMHATELSECQEDYPGFPRVVRCDATEMPASLQRLGWTDTHRPDDEASPEAIVEWIKCALNDMIEMAYWAEDQAKGERYIARESCRLSANSAVADCFILVKLLREQDRQWRRDLPIEEEDIEKAEYCEYTIEGARAVLHQVRDAIVDQLEPPKKSATKSEMHRGEQGEAGKTATETEQLTCDELNAQFPAFEPGNADWISNRVAAKLLGVRTKRLTNQRHETGCIKCEQGSERWGLHDKGLFWRATGKAHPNYYLPQMKKHAGHLANIYPKTDRERLR